MTTRTETPAAFALTQTELYGTPYNQLTLATARKLYYTLAVEMGLSPVERAALGHAVTHFAARRAAGVLCHGGSCEAGKFAPIVGEGDGELAKNCMFRSACFISALRGRPVVKGDRVLGMHNGKCFFGTVVNVNGTDRFGDRAVIVKGDQLDDGSAPFSFQRGRATIRYSNMACDVEALAILELPR